MSIWNEILGYAGSFFVVASLCMASMRRLRWLNLVGCTLLVIYGLIAPAYPVVLLNGLLMLINLYHLRKLYLGSQANKNT